MTEMTLTEESLVDRTARHEGFSPFIYLDVQGYLTIGYGLTVGRLGVAVVNEALDNDRARHSLDSILGMLDFLNQGTGITEPQARELLRYRLIQIRFEMSNRSEISSILGDLNPDTTDVTALRAATLRSEVLTEMAYQLGIRGLINFKRMWKALAVQDFQTAASEMLDSVWARTQTPSRAQELAGIMLEGVVGGPALTVHNMPRISRL